MHKYQRKLLSIVHPNGLGRVTLNELGRNIGLSGRQNVKYHLDSLEKAGFIVVSRNSGSIVKIVPAQSDSNILSIPIYGEANCGEPTIVAESNFQGYLRISHRLFSGDLNRKEDYFAIRAVGESMDKSSFEIRSGDYVIVDSKKLSPVNGDTVLSVIDGAANIKRYCMKDDYIVLSSESSKPERHPPIIIHPDDNYIINGVVVQSVNSS